MTRKKWVSDPRVITICDQTQIMIENFLSSNGLNHTSFRYPIRAETHAVFERHNAVADRPYSSANVRIYFKTEEDKLEFLLRYL